MQAPNLSSEMQAPRSSAVTQQTKTSQPNRKRRNPPTDLPETARKSPRLNKRPGGNQKTTSSQDNTEKQHQSYQSHTQLPSPPRSKTPQVTPLLHSAKLQKSTHQSRKRKVEPNCTDLPQPSPKRIQTKKASHRNRAVFKWLSSVASTASESDLEMPTPVRKRSVSSMQPSDSATTTITSSPQTRSKSAFYRRKDYQTELRVKGSHMHDSKQGLLMVELNFCDKLLSLSSNVPRDSLFGDDCLRKTCEKLGNQNEARVIQDIALLLVPSAEALATRDSKFPDYLKETVDTQWDLSFAVHGPKPYPDYAVGFGYETFSLEQQKKIGLYPCHKQNTLVKLDVYFPFLTRESKSVGQLNIADRQNAHSMTVAMKGLVDLFRLVKRQQDLHRKILGFSISHDCQTVSIYAHYPEIEGSETRYFRHLIRSYSFSESSGQSQWTSYKFTRAVYDKFVPRHIKRIKEAIDKITNPSGLSFGTEALSVADEDSSQRGSQNATPSQDQDQMPPPPVPALEISQLQRQLEAAEKQSKDAKKQMDLLVKQLEQQREEAKQQREEAKQQNNLLLEQLEKQDTRHENQMKLFMEIFENKA
ncbi:MAG: hypothetical protein M1814_000899 [Vezdaea aestivalis]|nr:MAG: hypothetical protein M1814_000899 [Vezdaea aestivalis]